MLPERGIKMQKIRFDAGEQRHVRLLVRAAGDAPFRIKSADWELRWAGNIEAKGVCGIDGHVIDAFIASPGRKTSYTLAITYTINDETLIEQLELVVM